MRLIEAGTRAAVCVVCGCMSSVLLAAGGTSFVGGEFRMDKPFPEFAALWREGWKLQDDQGQRIRYARPDMPLGGYVHAFVRNTSGAEMEIRDVFLDNVSLGAAIAPDGPGRNRDDRFASSIAFSKLPADQVAKLQAAGEPVWFKADPYKVPAGGAAEVVIRLRRVPRVERLAVRVAHNAGTVEGSVAVMMPAPRIVSIGFSAGMDTAYLFSRHAATRRSVKSVALDGEDVTSAASITSDPALNVSPIVIRLGRPVREGEFHLFECTYDDGSVARSSIRVDSGDFVYGMWGGMKSGTPIEQGGPKYVEDLRQHNINTIMEQYGGEVRKFIRSDAGQTAAAKHGIRIMDHFAGSYPNQRYVFLHDEPDAKDIKMENLPLDKRIGTRGQWLVGLTRKYRQEAPGLLQLLNIDNTFKPENWYTYAQLPDVPCADPYFQEQLRSVYETDPGNLAAYTRPTYVFAAGTIYQSACAPKPMHLILHTCRFDIPDFSFRPPTPEEKRVELYYSIAAGARGISFWWYTAGDRFHGVGSDAPEMRRLFAEIGLVGAELRTAEPLLMRACPVELATKPTPMLWARTLLAGSDTVVLVAVNDNIACDRSGMVVGPLENARVSVRLPAWVQPRDAFEIAADGLKPVTTKSVENALAVELGHVDVTRLVVVTANTGLRSELQKRYDTQFAETARALRAPLAK